MFPRSPSIQLSRSAMMRSCPSALNSGGKSGPENKYCVMFLQGQRGRHGRVPGPSQLGAWNQQMRMLN